MNHELLKLAQGNIIKLAGTKEAFVPADQLQGGMSAMAGAPPGAPPGMPPGAPPGMPMDPMAAGGAPPMPPEMMGGMPPMPPMPPGMEGAMPPGMAAGGAPPGQVTLNIEDLRSVVMEAVQAAMLAQSQMGAAAAAAPAPTEPPSEGEKGKEGGNTEQRLGQVEQQLQQLTSMLSGMPPDMAGIGMGGPAAAAPGGSPMGLMGTPSSPPAPSPGMAVQASDKSGYALGKTLAALGVDK